MAESQEANSISQLVFDNPQVSNHHLKVYSIIHDLEGKSGIRPLVYAEDLSTNGTYWNGSLMGKNNGGFLICDGDQLRIYPKIILTYHSEISDDVDEWDWDDVQAKEMRVRQQTLLEAPCHQLIP